MFDSYKQAASPSEPINPYAAPLGKPFLDVDNAEAGEGVWRDGNLLVVQKGAALPDRCIRCNAPAEGRRLHRQVRGGVVAGFRDGGAGAEEGERGRSRLGIHAATPDRGIRCIAGADGRRLHRQLYWHPPLLYCLYFFGGPIVYVLAAVCVRQQLVIEVGICGRHRAARSRSIAICWLIALISLATIVIDIGRGDQFPFVFLLALLAFLFDLCYAARISRLIVAQRIDADDGWLKKVHPAYLNELPTL